MVSNLLSVVTYAKNCVCANTLFALCILPQTLQLYSAIGTYILKLSPHGPWEILTLKIVMGQSNAEFILKWSG